MKKIVLPMFLMLLIIASGCKKHVASDCLKVKVIRVTCASTVMQVLSDNSIGDDGWSDIFGNSSRYDNVFVASNACHIPSEYKVGDVIYITIGKPTTNDCVQCAMFDAPPKTSYKVKTIGNLPCREELSK